MQNFGSTLRRALSALMCVTALAGCTTSGAGAARSPELVELVSDLAGVKGKTLDDQRNIDRTVARSCSTGLMTGEQCDLHTKASAERKAEIND